MALAAGIMSNPNASWERASVDPTAGVRLVTRVYRCPRCGIVKGAWSQVRRTLCHDCVDVLTPEERLEWRAAA